MTDISLVLLLQSVVRPLTGEDLVLALQEVRERPGGDGSQGQEPLSLSDLEVEKVRVEGGEGRGLLTQELAQSDVPGGHSVPPPVS